MEGCPILSLFMNARLHAQWPIGKSVLLVYPSKGFSSFKKKVEKASSFFFFRYLIIVNVKTENDTC